MSADEVISEVTFSLWICILYQYFSCRHRLLNIFVFNKFTIPSLFIYTWHIKHFNFKMYVLFYFFDICCPCPQINRLIWKGCPTNNIVTKITLKLKQNLPWCPFGLQNIIGSLSLFFIRLLPKLLFTTDLDFLTEYSSCYFIHVLRCV